MKTWIPNVSPHVSTLVHWVSVGIVSIFLFHFNALRNIGLRKSPRENMKNWLEKEIGFHDEAHIAVELLSEPIKVVYSSNITIHKIFDIFLIVC